MGWLGFVFVGGGVLSIWAGFQGVKLTDVIKSVLTGSPMPVAPDKVKGGTETTGGSGGSGFAPDPKTGAPPAAGSGAGSGGGGGW